MKESAREPGAGPASGDRAPPRSFLPGNWGWELVVGVAILGWVLMGLGMVGARVLLGHEPFGPWIVDGRLLLSTAPAHLFTIGLCYACARFYDPATGVRRLGIGARPLREFGRGLLWYVPIGATVWLGILGYQELYRFVLGEGLAEQAPVELARDATLSPGFVVLLFVQVAGLTAFAEEFFFRGLLHGWLRKHLRFWPSACIGGVAFGLVHGFDFALPLALFGVLLAWLREQVGLLAAVAAHALHNGIYLALLRFGTELT